MRDSSSAPAPLGDACQRLRAALRPGSRLREVVLFLHAVRLARLAQGVRRGASLPAVIASMASLPALPRGVAPAAARCAAARACIRGARWLGLRDTCLVRSLVVGSLLSDRDLVLLHVGFAPPSAGGGVLEGHAWVSVDGEVVGGPAAAMTGEEPATDVVIALRRPEP